MRFAAACLIGLAACGRVDFDPLADSSLDSDLLLHFTFDDVVTTNTGSVPHDGTCASCPVAVPGHLGTAAQFSLAQCMHVADAPEYHPPAFTYTEWLFPRVVHEGTTFSHPLNGATTANNTFEIAVRLAGTWDFIETNLTVSIPGPSLVWHHVAAVFDGTTLSVYLDGQFQTSAPEPTAMYADDEILLGCDVNVGAQANLYDGMLDDVRLYGRALNDTEIRALAAM